jgi:plastocyanin
MRVSPVLVARVILVAAIVTVGVVAFLAQSSVGGSRAAAQPPTEVVVVTPPTVAPAPTPRPQPTQTPQAITSIILRETSIPYPTSTPPPANQPMVSVVDFSYMPGIVRIKAGQTVMWRNDGTEQHDITGSDWHSGPLDPGSTYRLTFGLPGTYAYRCSIHLDMTGSVIVT